MNALYKMYLAVFAAIILAPGTSLALVSCDALKDEAYDSCLSVDLSTLTVALPACLEDVRFMCSYRNCRYGLTEFFDDLTSYFEFVGISDGLIYDFLSSTGCSPSQLFNLRMEYLNRFRSTTPFRLK